MRTLIALATLIAAMPASANDTACRIAIEVGYVTTIIKSNHCDFVLNSMGIERIDDLTTRAYDKAPDNFGVCYDYGKRFVDYNLRQGFEWQRMCDDVFITLYSDDKSWER